MSRASTSARAACALLTAVVVGGAPAAALAAEAWSARLRRAGALPLRVRRDARELDLLLESPVVVR
jgi:hypothetical protein